MDASLPVLCGSVSTVMFMVGTLPMLVKAARTRDLSSYSVGNIALSNAGNAINTVYVLSLPPGPVWFLHGFYVVTTALMLFWYVRYSPERRVDHAVDLDAEWETTHGHLEGDELVQAG
jgi:hypothetical protein